MSELLFFILTKYHKLAAGKNVCKVPYKENLLMKLKKICLLKRRPERVCHSFVYCIVYCRKLLYQKY